MRDVLAIPAFQGEIVLACDSLGAIGPKKGDQVQVPLRVSARFTARVALAEILSLGAEPLAIVLTLSVEPYPFLEEARKGIQEELAVIGKEGLPVLFSSEKNMKTRQTGLGVTVVGRKIHPLPLPSLPLFLYALGVPSCGPEVLAHEGEIADLKDILYLRTLTPLILPVGSQGVFCEALTVAREVRAKLHLSPPFPHSLFRSCGPATVVLFGSPKEEASLTLSKPVWRVGTLRPV